MIHEKTEKNHFNQITHTVPDKSMVMLTPISKIFTLSIVLIYIVLTVDISSDPLKTFAESDISSLYKLQQWIALKACFDGLFFGSDSEFPLLFTCENVTPQNILIVAGIGK